MTAMDNVCVIVKVLSPLILLIMLSLYMIGVLCGECRDEMGVSALLSRCVDCSNVNALLIVTLSNDNMLT